MSDQDKPTFFYPNKIGRIILLAMEEIIGRNGVNAVLNQANLRHLINHYPADNLDREVDFDVVSRIQVALEELYGPRGGRGLALRSGRACLKYGLREFGALFGFTDLSFRLLPLDAKIQKGAQIFSDIFNKYSDQVVQVEEESERFLWKIDRCPVCWDRKTEAPVCHLAVGILQEGLYWVSGGKFYNVEEIECIAKGDVSCIIAIDKQALDY